MLISPPWTLFNIIFHIGFAATGAFIIYSDYYDKWAALHYSKFSKGAGIPTRLGLFVIYFLPIVAATIFAWSYLPVASLIQWAVYSAVILHFTKRVLETLFLHKFSGTVDIKTAAMITTIYSIIAGAISYFNKQTIPAMDFWFYTGTVIFIIGELGSFYHHKLLVDLRKERDGYHIPQGGLFKYVTCPHYFFELVAWFGIVLLSRHLFTLIAFLVAVGYLTARSIRTHQWYQQRFPDYPADRKYIVPFLF